MKRLPTLGLLLLSGIAISSSSACDDDGEFDGGSLADGGPVDAGPSAAEIGRPCEYRYDLVNPSRECPTGLECFIFTGDLAYQTDLALSTWEDQTTRYLEGPRRDEGFCTLIGTLADPPRCPAGTALKLFSREVAACLRLCNEPSDCGRVEDTCDVRYLDVVDPATRAPLKTCVKKCNFDMPDCVRSGIFSNGQSPPTFIPMLSFGDMFGESQCDVAEGICTFVEQHGNSGPGEPCTATEQCEPGAICIQAPILAAVLEPGANVDANGPGFCASPCTPVAESDPSQQANCSPGFVCQDAGNLTLGFPEMLLFDQPSQTLESRGGFCFHQCVNGVDADCGSVPGTRCATFDVTVAGGTSNNQPMCLPEAIARGSP